MDLLRIEKLKLQCVLGVYPNERISAQAIEVDLSLGFDAGPAARSDQLSDTIDYGWIIQQIEFVLSRARFQLIESAANALCQTLLVPQLPDECRPPIVHASVKITKPEALCGHAIPSITLHRDLPECDFRTQEVSFGRIDTLHESSRIAIHRIGIAPRASFVICGSAPQFYATLALSECMECENEPLQKGKFIESNGNNPRHYRNPSFRWQSLLCVSSPNLINAIELTRVQEYSRKL